MTLISVDDELIAARASGTLSAPMRLLVDTHAVLKTDVAAAALMSDALSGAFLEGMPAEPMAENALDIALAAIDALESGAGEAAGTQAISRKAAAAAADSVLSELLQLPEPVRDRALEAGAQWRFAAPGVRRIELMREGDATAELLRIEPGHGSPSHTHNGKEFTLVLAGAFADGIGRYEKGDLCAVGEETTHRPIAEQGEICFALAVTDGSLKFTGALGAVQRLLGH
ncbi:ChrR family anti-sigma-E factor [Hyphobacterium sp.]|uniref:ChrR family anti-sigma-E factor n=1 Tax=Hyphobacterium sp. TaxID=2004662 RepID=UPI00374A917E